MLSLLLGVARAVCAGRGHSWMQKIKEIFVRNRLRDECLFEGALEKGDVIWIETRLLGGSTNKLEGSIRKWGGAELVKLENFWCATWLSGRVEIPSCTRSSCFLKVQVKFWIARVSQTLQFYCTFHMQTSIGLAVHRFALKWPIWSLRSDVFSPQIYLHRN